MFNKAQCLNTEYKTLKEVLTVLKVNKMEEVLAVLRLNHQHNAFVVSTYLQINGLKKGLCVISFQLHLYLRVTCFLRCCVDTVYE